MIGSIRSHSIVSSTGLEKEKKLIVVINTTTRLLLIYYIIDNITINICRESIYRDTEEKNIDI